MTEMFSNNTNVCSVINAIEAACIEGDLDKVKLCVQKLPRVYWCMGTKYRMSDKCLTNACETSNINLVKYVMDHFYDPWCLERCSKDDLKYYLKMACKGGYSELIKLVIKNGARDWNCGLYGACEGGHVEVIKFMYDKGANNLSHAYLIACKHKRVKAVEYLRSRDTHGTLLYHKWSNIFETGFVEMAETMISNKVILGYNEWKYCLQRACLGKNINCVQLILRYNASYITPEDMIAATNSALLCIFFREYIGENGRFCLKPDDIHVIIILVRTGADPNCIYDKYGDISSELYYLRKNFNRYISNTEAYFKAVKKYPAYALLIGCRTSKCYTNKLPTELFRLLFEY